MPCSNHDRFGPKAREYAQHRPTYPEAFFTDFAARAPGQSLVWDCGCGNGQAARALASVFAQVVATDVSAHQIQQAQPHPRVSYRTANANASDLAATSVDAILVAQAVHWFGGDSFNAEVRRVAKPGAAMAWIGYRLLQLEDQPLQALVEELYAVTLAPWWAPERALVDQDFAGLPFPGLEWEFPQQLWIERHWSLPQLVGYLNSWSAVAAAQQAGQDPIPGLQTALAHQWPGPEDQTLRVRWPFMGRWGEVRS